jgi:class 3 adenylate cyclase/tetratricopeptide (TPR) repeat protein
VSHTALRLEFDLDDRTLDALRCELVDVLSLAKDDGRVLSLDAPNLAPSRRDESSPTALPARPPATHGSLTVLLCDVVSTPAARALDAAARGALSARVHAICNEVARRLRGHVQPWVGDGVAILFGHPRAHEDDALRAVRCAWEILRTVESASDVFDREFGLPAAVRIGIATGASADGADAAQAFGDTPRIAARAQAAAKPGAVAVDEPTRARAAARFAFQARDGVFILSGPLDASVQTTAHAPAPLVGRTGERALLRALAERATDGTRSAVLLRGAPGIGKSRLIASLRSTATGDLKMQVLECRSSPNHRGSPLHPVLEGLRRHWQLDGAQASVRLADGVHRAGGDDRAVALLAGMLDVALVEGVALGAVSPRRRRREALGALVDAIEGEARRTPLLLVLEDLHWADPSTIELFETLLNGGRELPLLLALTARSDYSPPAGATLQRLDIGPLDYGETLRLIERVADGSVLPEGVVDELAERSCGSPLLTEELTRTALAIQDSGSSIAATLYASVMARLDRDCTARSVARLAATVGCEFDVSLLLAHGEIARSELDWGLERLASENIIRPAGPGIYAFRHALLQDAARSSLRRRALREHNLQIAQTLLTRFPHVAAAEPARVARHFEYAGRLPESVRYWQRAGLQALGQAALQEAAGHFERGLELTARTADGPDRRAMELALRVLAGHALAAAQGWEAPEPVAHFARADELTGLVDPTPQVFRAQIGLATYRLVSGRVEDALALARMQMAVAEAAGYSEFVLEAECEVGGALVHLGRHREALAHLTRVVEIYDPVHYGEHAVRFGRNPAAIAYAHRGLALACRDDLDGARLAIHSAAELLRAARHPYSEAWVHCAAAAAALVLDQREVVGREATLALQIATREGFDDWLAQASVLRGWARVRGGDLDGMHELRRGLAAWEATGALIMRPFFHGLLADALGFSGEPELGLAEVDAALAWIPRGERWCEPELHRWRAELALQCGDEPGARRSAQHAVSLARRTGAAGLERRANATLARVRRDSVVS